MKKLLSALVAVLLMGAGAQARDWQQVQQLYRAGMYSEAVRLLGDDVSRDAQAWRSLCVLRMHTPGAIPQAASFLERNPDHILAPQIRFVTALSLFDAGEYQQALEQFEQIKGLYPEQEAEFTYKKGYSAYSVGEWDYAVETLSKVDKAPYQAPAQYNLGYIHYARKQFREAEKWFRESARDYRFSLLSRYYILECRFNEKDYAYVVENGDELFESIPEDRRSHLSRIMGESHLVLGNVDKAGTYYELDHTAAPTRSDHFYAGEIFYLQQNWQGAVDQFTRMGERTDSLGQIASYQLGYSYIRLKNKVQAMPAFKEAADAAFSPEIREDAFYNYAKLAFDLGRDTKPFQEYLNRYGTREKGDRIYTYMAMAALQNHDYEGAVAAYDQIDELEPRMLSNYMKAYFLRARELMEAGSWRAAVPHLKAAAYYSDKRDPFNQLCRYYQAEACYRDGRYGEARGLWTELYNQSALSGRTEGSLIPYQLGYTCFKEADYPRALKWFNSYLGGSDKSQGSDALIRVGDCHFFSGDYSSAVKAYERQLSDYPGSGNLYPRLMAGVAAGLQGNDAKKASLLEKALQARPAAPYYGESLYELGRAYVALGKNEDAVKTFNTLRNTTKDPSLNARSLLELGMISRNAGRSQDALDYYKAVVARGGEYAEDALLAIEAIYRTRQDPDAYLAYVNSLGDAANRTESQKEEVYFSSAEQMYLSGDYARGLTTLQTYLEKYPQPAFGAKARFYLAECYRFTGNRQQASDNYQLALKEGLDGALEESATLQYAHLGYELGNYAEAYRAYDQLRINAQLQENRKAAYIGLMRCAHRSREWENALSAADVVLNSLKADGALQREARYVSAKALMGTSRRSEALEVLKLLSREPATDEGAEARYLLIQDSFDRGDFADVQEQVYAFSEKAGGQNYWLAKAFILLGDSFAEQGNDSQARATFESIKSGYTSTGPQDDVLDQVNRRLSKL